jgi:hypothetical protein
MDSLGIPLTVYVQEWCRQVHDTSVNWNTSTTKNDVNRTTDGRMNLAGSKATGMIGGISLEERG